jgi:hypothetical protein
MCGALWQTDHAFGCAGALGTTYTKIGPAAEMLLWRRPLHQAVHAYVDGALPYCPSSLWSTSSFAIAFDMGVEM